MKMAKIRSDEAPGYLIVCVAIWGLTLISIAVGLEKEEKAEKARQIASVYEQVRTAGGELDPPPYLIVNKYR